MAEALGYPRWERLEASVPVCVSVHATQPSLATELGHRCVLQFLIQYVLADVWAASSGLFSMACWAKEGGMG